MVHKIFTPSWLHPESVQYRFFLFEKELKNTRLHTKNQLLKLLDTTKKNAGPLIRYDHFENIPHITTSISHGQRAGAVICANKELTPGLGIDVEEESRVITPRASKFFVNSSDEGIDDKDLIYFWAKKEAAFKATSPLNQEVKLLKDLWIKNNQFGKVGFKDPAGEVDFTVQHGQIIATAYLFKTTLT